MHIKELGFDVNLLARVKPADTNTSTYTNVYWKDIVVKKSFYYLENSEVMSCDALKTQ